MSVIYLKWGRSEKCQSFSLSARCCLKMSLRTWHRLRWACKIKAKQLFQQIIFSYVTMMVCWIMEQHKNLNMWQKRICDISAQSGLFSITSVTDDLKMKKSLFICGPVTKDSTAQLMLMKVGVTESITYLEEQTPSLKMYNCVWREKNLQPSRSWLPS